MNTSDHDAKAAVGHTSAVTATRWPELARLTPARVALGRSGTSLPTRQWLDFGLARARARDAIDQPLDLAHLQRELEHDGWPWLVVCSRAPDRQAYLARPDWGRRLHADGRARLDAARQGACDLAVVISDGLSSAAIHAHARSLLRALRPHLNDLRWAPLVIATQARVALADEVGEVLGARMALSLIGERPGLSSPDSLGIYLTATPRVGRHDAERDCISNIHAAGLGYAEAAEQAARLVRAGLQRGRSGVAQVGVDACSGPLPAPPAT